MKPRNFVMSILTSLAFLISLVLLITIKYETSLKTINILLNVCTGLLLITIIFSDYIIKEVRFFFNILSLVLIVLFGSLVLMDYDYNALDIILIISLFFLLLITLTKHKVLENENIKAIKFFRGFKENNLSIKISKLDNLLENKIITETEHQKMRKNIIDNYMK